MRVILNAPLLIYLNTVSDDKRRLVYEDFYLRVLSEHKPTRMCSY